MMDQVRAQENNNVKQTKKVFRSPKVTMVGEMASMGYVEGHSKSLSEWM